MISLEALRKKYSNAPYSFFRVWNYETARKEFMRNPDVNPIFTYSPVLNKQNFLRKRDELSKLLGQAEKEGDEYVQAFIERRLAETDLILTFLAFSEQPGDSDLYRQYRKTMKLMYGSFDKRTFQGIVTYLRDRAEATSTQLQYEAIEQRLNGHEANGLYQPSEGTFRYYRQLVADSDHPLMQVIESNPAGTDPMGTYEAFERALYKIGADNEGWQVVHSEAASNVMISRHNRKIVIGKHFRPDSPMRLSQVVAHEVIIHVRRTLLHDNHQSPLMEEGIALLAEQLLARRFIYRRLLRYFAAALAWGVDGRPRDFKETFDILWRAFIIVGGHGEDEAKRRAFQECTRIFRGGLPDVPGAAYIKDKVYLESNLIIWRQLEDNKLGKQEFLNLIDGVAKEQLDEAGSITGQ